MSHAVTCEDCNENADCIEGQCVCKDSYTGDGLSCEEGKFKVIAHIE